MSNIAGISNQTYDTLHNHLQRIDEGFVIKAAKKGEDNFPALIIRLEDDKTIRDEKTSFERAAALATEMRQAGLAPCTPRVVHDPRKITEIIMKLDDPKLEEKLNKMLGITDVDMSKLADTVLAVKPAELGAVVSQLVRDQIPTTEKGTTYDPEKAADLIAGAISALNDMAQDMGIDRMVSARVSKGPARGGR